MEELPRDVLLAIFSFLDHAHDVASISQWSFFWKRWIETNSALIWRQFFLKQFPSIQKPTANVDWFTETKNHVSFGIFPSLISDSGAV